MDTTNPMHRRAFLRLAATATATTLTAFVSATLAACQSGLSSGLIIGGSSPAPGTGGSTPPPGGNTAGLTAVAPASQLQSTPQSFDVGNSTVYAYEDGTNQPVVLSNVCPHQGCAVFWSNGSGSFNCPCHGSVFDKSGNVVNGPARSPLQSYQAQIVNGKLYIQA